MNATRFEFATAKWIIFEAGSAEKIADNALALGSKPLIVTGKNQERCKFLLDDFTKQNIKCEIYSVKGEPTTKAISECMELETKVGLM